MSEVQDKTDSPILVLHASTGNGHVSAAKALERELQARGRTVFCRDALDFAPPYFRLWYAGGYEEVVRRKAELWGWLYRISDVEGVPYEAQTWMDEFFLSRLEPYIDRIDPAAIICTHSLPQPKLAALRDIYGFKFGVVVTDLHPHKMWLRGTPDRYFVPADWSLAELSRRDPTFAGIAEVTGIPVHEAFSQNAGLPPEFAGALDERLQMVLLTAGGIGAGGLDKVAESLAAMEHPCHLVVVCGRNDSVYRRITARKLGSSSVRVHVVRRVPLEQMAWLMRRCTLMVGKPGGLTVSEALVCGCPFIVHEPLIIPGQEEDNARFLVNEGVGVQTTTDDHLRLSVQELLAAPERLAGMKANALRHGRADATKTIIDAAIRMAAGRVARTERPKRRNSARISSPLRERKYY